MKIIDVEQGSLEWLSVRAGIPTASEWDALVTPKWEIRKGQGVETYLAQKVAEAWLQSPLPGFMTIDMEVGKIQESEAIPAYCWETGQDIQRVGFITTDDGRLGCSPDGLIGDNSGIELKCPEAKTHASYLLKGEIPDQYLSQVHGSMYVTGRTEWIFMSYRRKFPMFVRKVERDERIQKVISEALGGFLAKFDAAIARLVELNGGRPITRMARNQTPLPQPQLERIDIVP